MQMRPIRLNITYVVVHPETVEIYLPEIKFVATYAFDEHGEMGAYNLLNQFGQALFLSRTPRHELVEMATRHLKNRMMLPTVSEALANKNYKVVVVEHDFAGL